MLNYSSHQIPWNVAISRMGLDISLATGDRESGTAAKGVDDSHAVVRQPFTLHPVGLEYHSE